MPTIDIDFEVFKQLTLRRETEAMTYNDVIRNLLELRGPTKVSSPGKAWVVSDTSFPVGSEFRAEYKGKTYSGSVVDGKLQLANGHKFSTPSSAAMYVTGTNVNGWRFWKCKLPSAASFVLIERLRGKSH